jgi:uncharacterized protein involved in exopolysaccharide biosynthesis
MTARTSEPLPRPTPSHTADDRTAHPDWLLLLLQKRRLIICVAFAVSVLVAILTLTRARSFSSEASFVPQSRRAQSGASALAAQLGFSLPGADASGTPAYYADLITSRSVLDPLLSARFAPPAALTSGRPRTLSEEFKVTADDPRRRRVLTETALRRALAVNVSPKTGVITFAAKASSDWMAKAIADSVLASLDRFNVAARQAQARDELRFTEGRLEEVRAELRAAEEREESFLQRNRDFRNSPQLTFEHERIARDVALEQQVYSSLSQSAEQMKVEQLRDTPVLTILDRPQLPAMPDGRGTARRTIVAFLMGALLGTAWALLRAFAQHLAAGSIDPAPSDDEVRRTLLDLLHPWRLLRPARADWYR